MKELQNRIDQLVKTSNCDPHIIDVIKNEESIPPFSTESRLLAYLLSVGKINYDDYSEISSEFCRRIQCPYISLFDMAPRTFGQTWGEQHIRRLFPQFLKSTKDSLSTLYPSFNGEFDLWIDGIRVEVKACRANSTASNGSLSLSSRAYTHEEAKRASFKYHFQQLKPSCCDVFIWIGVCKDELIYWTLTSDELQRTGKLGPQHRNENTGVAGEEVFEGQVFMTEDELSPFLVDEQDILSQVIKKGKKK